MDGSDRTVLVSSGLVWVNSLALDFQNRLLYWCDARLDKIERVDLQGNNRLVVLDLSPSNLHPFGLALADHVLYWSDWNYQSVHTYNMTSNVSDVLVHGMGRPMELHIHNQMDIYNSNYDFLIINLFFDERRQVSQVFYFQDMSRIHTLNMNQHQLAINECCKVSLEDFLHSYLYQKLYQHMLKLIFAIAHEENNYIEKSRIIESPKMKFHLYECASPFFTLFFLMHTCVGCFSKCSIIRLSSLHIEQESLSFHKDQPAALN